MRLLRRLSVAILCGCLLLMPKESRAESLNTAAAEIVIGIVAVTVALTVGVVLIVTHKPSITGCVMQGDGGLSLTNEGDNKTYILRGVTSSVSVGQRVRVSGKKHKGASGNQFDVVKMKKDFGPCPALHS